MARTVARWMVAGAAFAAAMGFQATPSYAFGDAPWCAVIGLGPGDAYWDCQYQTFDECLPHVLAGNRGVCNPNPWPGPASSSPKTRRHHSAR